MAHRATSSAAIQAATTVHCVKVSLHGSRPPVWRRIEIPSAMRLDLLPEVMQVAFGWHGYHLHAFETVCGEFGAPDDDDDWADRKDETTAALAQVAAAEKAKVVYTYDFGDDWRLDIVVEKIMPAEPGVAYPRCTGGRREAPPEDCGGIWAFNEYQAELDDTFDAAEVTAQLAGLAGGASFRLPEALCLTGECLYRRAPSTSSTRRSPITETPGRGSRS
jgi:hypothetical protein